VSFSVYKSSAGSGKTFTLVREYLKLILPEPQQFRHILAITFTNKVANEMKERVLFNLKELSKPQDERDPKVNRDLLPMLITDTGLSENQIRGQSEEALKLILHNYSDFAIGTIDSFSHRVIRTFAHDFGLPVGFNVELDSDELLKTAVDLLLDKVGDDPDLTGLLVKFLESRMDEERSWNIDSILINFSKVLLDEEGMTHLQKLNTVQLSDFDGIVQELYRKIVLFETRIKAIAAEAVALIDHYSIPSAAFYQGERGIGGYFEKLAKGRIDLINSDTFASATIREDKWTGSKADTLSKNNISLLKPALTGVFLKIGKERELNQKDYILFKMLTKTIYPLAVLREIDRTLSEFKKQNNIVHISEFNRRIAEIVLNEPVPFIYERLGEKFNHLLIDEFQDTSRLQWNNLQPLIENSLASGYFNLIVGDGKQAIYRWRNGDVQQFADLPSIPGSAMNKILADREKILSANYKAFPLKKNYRSKAGIIDFNNKLFTSIAEKFASEIGNVYEDLVQDYDASKTGGYVRVEFMDSTEGAAQYRENTILKVLDLIGNLKKKNFRLKDIAILCRKNKDAGEIARFLIHHGIEVISAESLVLSHSAEVNFITGLIRLMNDPLNSIISAEVATWLFQTGRLKGNGLHDILSQVQKEKPGPTLFTLLHNQGLDFPLQYLTVLPVFELCEELIRLFSLNTIPDPYLQFFLDAVLKYSRKNPTNPLVFLEWWENHKNKLSVIIPDGLNAVRIMSIHKAKGLQFPIVIYPFAHDKKDYGKDFLWVDLPENKLNGLKAAMVKPQKELAETDYADLFELENKRSFIDLVNLFYVAMTRAENQLYVLSQAPSKSATRTPSIPVFLENYFKGAGEWEDEKPVYEFGLPDISPQPETDVPKTNSVLTTFISNDWRRKVHIRTRAPEAWNIEEPQKKKQWGNLLHSVLSRITTISDVDPIINEITASGMIEECDKEKLLLTIIGIMKDPASAAFFGEGINVRKETEILLKNGDFLRPDRVILKDENAIVIDFKTGKTNEKHADQVRQYETHLKTMGYREVEKYLLYTEPEVKVVEVE
jgi:ATP-dependent exoDNAse (exonuclease V) beta subunit